MVTGCWCLDCDGCGPARPSDHVIVMAPDQSASCVSEFQAERGQSQHAEGEHPGGRPSAAVCHHLPPIRCVLPASPTFLVTPPTLTQRAGGLNAAPTLFHSLLICGLTERPSERRELMSVAERESERARCRLRWRGGDRDAGG